MEDYCIYSVADYIEAIKYFKNGGIRGVREGVRLYYRGEPDDYGKSAGTPSIARGEWLEKNKESRLFRECERRLPREFANCRSTFEKLVLMQHYQIRTRLLDISLDPLQALFFALYIDPKSKADDNRDCMVLVYEIPDESVCSWHSDKVSVISNIAVFEHDLDIKNLPDNDRTGDSLCENDKFNENEQIRQLVHEIRAEKPYFQNRIIKNDMEAIYCVHPLLDNPRIKAQQGAFLLFGMNGNKHNLATLESNKGPEIRMAKIRIMQGAKARIREELELIGLTVDVVYPDWQGVSDYFERFSGKKAEDFYK